jgi:hypothetical protein
MAKYVELMNNCWKQVRVLPGPLPFGCTHLCAAGLLLVLAIFAPSPGVSGIKEAGIVGGDEI